MKNMMLPATALVLGALGMTGCAETTSAVATTRPALVSTAAFEDRPLEIGCARCTYGIPGASCGPAAKIEGHGVLLKGVALSAHDLGLCQSPKQAIISGKVEGGELIATKVEVQ